MALISCEEAAFAYETGTAVRGLSFAVNAGDYLCVVGENGSGKSTLIKGLLRLIQPSEGTVRLGDGLRPDRIGYLPQQTAAQRDFPASVREVVLSGRLGRRGLLPFYSKEDKARARENMRLLDIEALRNRCYRELSGGQQRRVLLARALCAAERLLLLDEPAAGLDPPATRELYRAISRINREAGIAVVMVSHDIQNAVKHASHILHLKNRQVFFGAVADYLRSEEALRFVGGNGNA